MQVDPSYEKQIRVLANNKQIMISQHARERMGERCISLEEAIDAIINGPCNYQEPPGKDYDGKDWKDCRLHFLSQSSKYRVIVTAGVPPVIVTVF